MGPSSALECWGQQVLTYLPLLSVLLADKDGEPGPSEEALDEIVPEYQAPGQKSMLAIWQLDPGDVSLVKYKQALLGPLPPIMGIAWGLDVEGCKQGEGTVGTAEQPVDAVSPQTPACPTYR